MNGMADPPRSLRIVQARGDPFEAESLEGGEPPRLPPHEAILNKLFYQSTVDIGGIVEIDGIRYACTKAGWRLLPPR